MKPKQKVSLWKLFSFFPRNLLFEHSLSLQVFFLNVTQNTCQQQGNDAYRKEQTRRNYKSPDIEMCLSTI